MNEAAMQKLAQDTGGKFYREEDLHTMANSIQTKKVSFSQRDEILLWNRWFFIALVALLTLEWFIRKFNGMS
jgi:hypothetical protein